MQSEWTKIFRFVCSIYSGEIAELLEETEYKSLGEELKKADNKDLYMILAEKKAECYYEQAAIVVLKHLINLMRETNIM